MPSSKFSQYYRDFTVIIFNSLLLFVAINFLAFWWMKNNRSTDKRDSKYVPKSFFTAPANYVGQLQDSTNLLYQVYEGYTEEELRNVLSSDLMMVDHPTLGIMVKPGEEGAFHVGTEGVRFDPIVRPDNVDSLLRSGNAVWCLGGSTTYGYKIRAAETIPYQLSLADSLDTYINLGVPSYHQNMEINKLMILLKKGYLPKKVLFLDGNNDFFSLARMNFHPAEVPSRANLAYPQATNFNNLSKAKNKIHWNRLPIIFLLQRFSKKQHVDSPKAPGLPYENLNDPNALYFQSIMEHFTAVKKMTCDTLLQYFPDRILQYYQTNQQFVDKLAQAYGFEYEFLFQPLGFLHEHNPFIKDFETLQNGWACFDVMYNTQQTIRDSIRSGALVNFRDLSYYGADCKTCFVDLVHYNGFFNQELARSILAPKQVQVNKY